MKHDFAMLPTKLLFSGFCEDGKPLSMNDLNLLSILCSYIKPGQPKQPVKIEKSSLAAVLKATDKTGFYRNLKASLIRLQSFVFNISDSAPVNVHAINLFEHTNNHKESHITIDFGETFYRLVTDTNKGTQGYSRVNVDSVLQLQKGVSKRIYLLLDTFSKEGETYMTIEALREKIGYSERMKDNSNFVNRVLIPAINEIIFTDKPVKFVPHYKNPNRKKKQIIGFTFSFIERKEKINVNKHLTAESRSQLGGYIKGKLYLSEEQSAHLINRVPVSEIVRLGKIIETAISESRSGKRSGERRLAPEKYPAYAAKTFRLNFPAEKGDLFAALYIPFKTMQNAA